jgi:TolB-like protein/DNA-binding winged helix-turn-helix (wHTH) protein/Tfp pilus assembly protein PilF
MSDPVEVQPVPATERVRFGAFEVDLHNGELRKHGIRVKLQEKPYQILCLLLEQPGEVVTREELQRRLWPADTFVDFDRNLNTAANRLRQALGDSADNPRFIETIPRRGYRLIVPVSKGNGNGHPQPNTNGEAPASGRRAETQPAPQAGRRKPPMGLRAVLASVAILALLVTGIFAVRATLQPEGSAGVGKTMLAVLPFENLSGDAGQDYLSDGLTDEMIAQIGRLSPGRLGVIARTSAMHYKGARKSVAEIGRELGVDYALEGGVRRSGNRVRITAQLVDVRSQSPLWSETYDHDEADLLAIQRDVAAHISSALALELLPAHTHANARAVSPNREAHEAYLMGRFHWNKRTTEGLQQALGHFQRAIEKDAAYAAAYAGLADTYLVMAYQFLLPPKEAYPKAKAAVERALQLDANLAEAHVSRAGITFVYDWDWDRAEQEFRRAIELNPSYASAHQWYAGFLSAMGRHTEALRENEIARRLDPLSLMINTQRGVLHYQAGQIDEALAACRKALELDPNFSPARVCLAMIYTKKQMYREGVLERQKAMAGEGYAREEMEAFWRAYATGGIRGAQRWLIDYRARRMDKQYIPGYYMAVLYGALGEKDKAFEWLERSYQQRDGFLTRLKVDPNLESLRDDPRFQSFLERMKLN